MKYLKYCPASIAALVILWASFAWRENLGLTPEMANWGSGLLTSWMTAENLGAAVIATVVIVVLAAPAERVLGTWRFVATAVVSQLIAVPVGVFAALAVETSGLNQWGDDLETATYLSPAGWVLATLAFASARMGVRWRRRTRVVLFAVTATLVLYAGTLAQVVGFLAVILGTVAGQLSLDRGQRLRVPRSSSREVRILVSAMTLAVAAGPVIAAANPTSVGPFAAITDRLWAPTAGRLHVHEVCGVNLGSPQCQELLAVAQQNGIGPFVANLMPLVLQIVIAAGLLRARRGAWWAALAFQIVTIAVLAAQLAEIDDFGVRFLVNLILVVLPWLLVVAVLLLTRGYFLARSTGWRRAIAIVLGALALTSALWVFGAWALRGSFTPAADLPLILDEWPFRFLPPALSDVAHLTIVPHRAAAWVLFEWVGTIFWITVAVVAYRLFTRDSRHDAEAARRAREILESGSGDHLSFMTLWEGNRYFFADSGAGYVAFRVHRGVAVTVGSPVVAAGADRGQVADEFESYAAASGWRVAWYSVAGDFAEGRAGYSRLQVASEAVIELDETSLAFKGKKFQNIRTARNRAGKESVTAQWTTWQELSPQLRGQILELSEAWVSEKALPEMGFTLGTVDELAIDGTRILVAIDAEEKLQGITSWLPVHVDGHIDGYVLDVMRRAPDSFGPVIDFLLSEAMVVASREVSWISLSGAPLAGGDASGILGGLLDELGKQMEPLYGFRSLAASKSRFNPAHVDWFLCYDDELALPSIGLAVAHAYLPQLSRKDVLAAAKIWRQSRRDRAPEKKERTQASSLN